MPQLPRTNEKQGGKSQGTLHDKMPLIAVYGPEKRRNLFRVRYRCMMLFARLRQGPFEIGRRVTLCPSGGDGIPEDLAGNGPDPVSRFKGAPAFYPAQAPPAAQGP